jgi:hypothetical protein
MVVVTAPEVVRDTTFIRLKMPIQSAKIAKKKKLNNGQTTHLLG